MKDLEKGKCYKISSDFLNSGREYLKFNRWNLDGDAIWCDTLIVTYLNSNDRTVITYSNYAIGIGDNLAPISKKEFYKIIRYSILWTINYFKKGAIT